MGKRRSRRRDPVTLKSIFHLREGIVVNWVRSTYKKFIVSYFAIYILLFILITTMLFVVSYRYYDEEFLKRVLAGVHGLIINMLVLGIILIWFIKKGQRLTEIQRYRDEIDDLRGFQNKEVSRRLRRVIVLLTKKGITEIDLSGCYFENVVLSGFNLRNSDFSGADFKIAAFRDCNLVGTKFHNAQLNNVDFDECDLSNADFMDSHLEGVDFSSSCVKGISFHHVYFNMVDLSCLNLKNVDFGSVIIDAIHFDRSDIEGAGFLWAIFKDVDGLTLDQFSKVLTLYGAEFHPEFEKRVNTARLRQLYPKLFERPEWLTERKPRYE